MTKPIKIACIPDTKSNQTKTCRTFEPSVTTLSRNNQMQLCT